MDSKLIIPCDSGIQPNTDMQHMLIEDFSVSDPVLGIVTKVTQALPSGIPGHIILRSSFPLGVCV